MLKGTRLPRLRLLLHESDDVCELTNSECQLMAKSTKKRTKLRLLFSMVEEHKLR